MNKGFVLLETIVVTAVLGIVLTMMYPAFANLITLTNTTNDYDNAEYIYRTNLYKKYVTTDIGSSDIKKVCENNCNDSNSLFFNVKAVYLVNPNKIGNIIGNPSAGIFVTTKRYLKYLNDNNSYTNTLLVIAYKDAASIIDDYKYASVELSKKENQVAGGVNPSLSNVCPARPSGTSMVNYLNNLVKSYDKTSTNMITLAEPSDRSCTNTFRFDNAKTYEDRLDNNLRFVGKNPCNYVSFNNELWRIIGVMNNIDDGTGKNESRVKIVRDSAIGGFSWDSSERGINSGYGINDWTQADLMVELNEDYLNYKTGTSLWYNGVNNQKDGVYNHSLGIRDDAKCLIGDAIWNLGNLFNTNYRAGNTYQRERSNNVFNGNVVGANSSGTGYYSDGCSDGYCPRQTKWLGKVALIYVSDFCYAFGSTDSYYESIWKDTPIGDFSRPHIAENDWLTPKDSEHLLTPRHSAAYDTTFLTSYGQLNDNYGHAASPFKFRPALYLRADTIFNGGNGTKNNPYKIK